MNYIPEKLTYYFSRISIHPAYIPFIIYMGGICTAEHTKLFIIFLCVLCLILGMVKKKSILLIGIFLYIFAFASMWNQTHQFNEFYDSFKQGAQCKKATIINIEQHHHIIYRYKIFVSGIFTNGIQEKNGTICIYCKHLPTNITVGDIVNLPTTKIKKPAKQSFCLYLMKEKINASSYVDELNAHLISRPRVSLKRFIWNIKNNQLANLKQKMNRKTFTLYSSLFLGNRSIVKNELDKHTVEFKTWGIMHYLARSGLHMVIFSMVLVTILACIPCSVWIRYLIVILLSIVYAILSWTSISFIRALIMFMLYTQAILFQRYSNGLHILIITCFATLLYNPFYLFFLDFQLSFFCTFILGFINQMRISAKNLN